MRTLLSTSLLLAIALVAAGCDSEDPTSAVVDNAFPIVDGGDPSKEIAVYKAWWATTLFLGGVAPGASSSEERTVPTTDFAYVLLAPGWDPTSSDAPARLVPVKSASPLSATRGDTLHIRVSDDAFVGDCAAGKPLSQEDADFITQRIFPGDFANGVFDAKTCTVTPFASDGGVGDAGLLD